MTKILDILNPGVLNSHDMKKIFSIAKEKKFAIPAINCIGIDSINAVLETANNIKSPVIIQLSYRGAKFIAGNCKKSKKKHHLAVIGAISAAKHVHLMAKEYGIPVILHTDHCNKELLPWIDELLIAGQIYYKKKGIPLFSAHMIDLSNERLKKNIKISKKYLTIMKKIDMILEIELGCTGGEEDGIDNRQIKKTNLYTKPEDVNYAYKNLISISPNFIIAASFGNVHGVYKPGNVKLLPKILKKSQEYISKKHNLSYNYLDFVFHGGSGSTLEEIKESIDYGIVKINIDTDIQWATWLGVLKYYKKYKKYLQTQIGNPIDINKPNKIYYDPRSWIRASQLSILKNLKKFFKKCNAINIL
ncbi:class II fructose-bisphosphate aldolase [Candidatus Purcelliella pentastirinorum]|uniref:class II fructose-bisphosphate aldolase n=1 Tax=Candidatus Purcelliella pentastirinorum TaxID=472834 RepID=UPI0023676832|nr:class II fructose-bisphosphate aldolase [Candidatus Purcelliella pentastirinorum]WDI79022.1 class II fructose-bisphosphate aldolase [Candidatus Purcelliella pentastirinorum]WDR80159.1 class II fructose-bisphosphate aldolase [Candidatus Purcelliella pentastirinorum]